MKIKCNKCGNIKRVGYYDKNAQDWCNNCKQYTTHKPVDLDKL